MLYLRLWWRFAAMSLLRDAAYRANLALGVIEGALQLVVAAATLAIIYRYTPIIAGWTRAEALLLLGVYRIVEGIFLCLIAENMWRVPGLIRRGEMDMLLLRPVSSRFMVSLRRVELFEIVNVLIGLGLVLYAARLADLEWSVAAVGAAVLLCGCGILLLYLAWLVCVSLAFWLIDTGPLSLVLETLRGTGRYPVSFFGQPMRVLLTVVFPVAFATSFPAQALRGQIDWRIVLLGIAMAAGGWLLAGRFWHFALRHYSSASS